jgi:chromosome partitioning protein
MNRSSVSEKCYSVSFCAMILQMADTSNLSTQITQELERTIGNQIRIFNTRIPRSVKVAEASGYQQTICEYRPKNPAAVAYEDFLKELMGDAG